MSRSLRHDFAHTARALAAAGAWAAVRMDLGDSSGFASAGEEEHRFELGSVTKVFTAFLLLRLADAGVTGEEECALTLLGLPSVNRLPMRALAAHASGLPEWPANFAPRPGSLFEHYSASELLTALASDAAELGGGPRYEYSSYGMTVLGLALSRRLGMSYAEACARFVLEPAGMHGAGFPTEPDCTRFGCFAPAGGAAATAADLRALLRVLLCPPDRAWERCLSRAEAVQLPTPIDGMAMALGWHVRVDGPDPVYWHNGRTPRGRAFVAYSRALGRGVALASNGDQQLDELGFALLADPGSERS